MQEKIEVVSQDPITIIKIIRPIHIGKRVIEFIGHGWAKRDPKDQPNPTVGIEIAMVRANLDIRRQRLNAKSALGGGF